MTGRRRKVEVYSLTGDEVDGATEAEALFDVLAKDSLDDGYYAEGRGPIPLPARLGTLIVFLLFGAVVAVAAVQAAQDQAAGDQIRQEIIHDITARRALIDRRQATVESLNAEVQELQNADSSVDQLDIWSAGTPVTGPGITITARSGTGAGAGAQITDGDLQLLVNGLWYAGAEAVSINGQRVGSTTAIRTAGQAVTVNYRALTEPYTVSAIGDPVTLDQRWTAGPSGRYWQQRQNSDGVSFSVLEVDGDLALPALPESRMTFRYVVAQ